MQGQSKEENIKQLLRQRGYTDPEIYYNNELFEDHWQHYSDGFMWRAEIAATLKHRKCRAAGHGNSPSDALSKAWKRFDAAWVRYCQKKQQFTRRNK